MNPLRVALITGAASGLGRGLALALARQGWSIAALDINEVGLRTLATELPSCATTVADVTQPAALTTAIQDLERRLGPTDLLVASAGIGLETSAHSLKPEDIAAVINVNLLGVVHSVAAVLPGMLERRRGHLVALSSIASFRGLPRMLAYCASKSGVNAFMEGIRAEVRGHGVDVTTICPGWVRTPMTANLKGRLPRILELDDAVRQILWAIANKRSFHAFPRGTVWQLRLLSWLPWSWQDARLARMSPKVGKNEPPV
jgi:NAD(P)-dependent dehydrogenase (short-subunit alcohol dehydrogenase family)